MDQNSPQGGPQYGSSPSPFSNPGGLQNLPNATAVLVLGIISIVGCFCYGIVGLACGIIALVLANKDLAKHKAAPTAWTPSSYNNLKAGRICAIIGIILSALYLTLIIIGFAIYGSLMTNPALMREMMENGAR